MTVVELGRIDVAKLSLSEAHRVGRIVADLATEARLSADLTLYKWARRLQLKINGRVQALHKQAEADRQAGLLGPLASRPTRADIVTAFRREARKHHPDAGGDPAAFHRLVQAKERALQRC